MSVSPSHSDSPLTSSTNAKLSPASNTLCSIPDTATSNASPVTPPFAGFAGRCFMRACLLAEMFDSWIRAGQKEPHSEISSAANGYDWHRSGWLRSSVGALACALAAAALVPIFWSSSERSWVPFFFLIVISFVALRFGQFAAVAGTICAALLFASILFEPRPSLAISNPVERNHLFSMVILGVCASEFLGRRRRAAVYKPH